MSIDSSDAASALASVAVGRRRAGELRAYAGAGNILIAWGLVWLVCNVVTFGAPSIARFAWPLGIAGAVLFTVTRSRERSNGRILATVAALLGFVLLALAITGGGRETQNAVMSALIAASYVVLGIWTGQRFIWLGLTLAAVIISGWFVFPAFLYLWLGVGGGGTLMLAGLWLRRA